MSTALERLLAEAIPQRPEPATPGGTWTTEEQDRHWNALCHAVGTPDAQRPTRSENEPHTGAQAA
ncbi:hypothetical protein [Streptomyces sp. NPDC002547]